MQGIRIFLDEIATYYSSGAYYNEIVAARKEFAEKVGILAEGVDTDFDRQADTFLDWFLFDRKLSKQEIPPVKAYLYDNGASLEDSKKEVFAKFADNVHSIFEVLKAKGSDVYLKDLLDGEKYVVEDVEVNQGFIKGDILETRLVQLGDRMVFGIAFNFHPKEAESFIKKQSKKLKNLDEPHRIVFMHQLLKMRNKVEQYSHIDIKHIYCEEPLL